jgi:RNA polymerase-interacting CarD/CdnL/TRCF family regulator
MNVWRIGGSDRIVTSREKQMLERARQAMESLVAEVATTAAITEAEAAKKTEG